MIALPAARRRNARIARRIDEIAAETVPAMVRTVDGCGECAAHAEALRTPVVRASWLRHLRVDHRVTA